MNEPTTLLNGHPYVHSTATDIRKTFAKARKQIAEQEAERERKRESERTTVRVIKRESAK